MASWFIPISFIRISQGEIFGNTSPHKYWKGFLSVKLRAKSNFKTLGLWSTKECGTQPTLRGNLFAFIISLFFMWTFKEILWKCPAQLFMNLQGEPPSHKYGNTWEGTRDPCKGTKPGSCQGKSASTAQEKSKWDLQEYSDIGKRWQNKMRGTTERCALEMTNGTS